MSDADINLALTSILFSAVGTAGQRCTSTRRLYLQRSIAPQFLQKLSDAYSRVPIGDPLDPATLVGPLHTPAAVTLYERAIAGIKRSGGEVLTGGSVYTHPSAHLQRGNYVLPAIVLPNASSIVTTEHQKLVKKIWEQEDFAPILKVAIFDELDEAIAMNNGVPQGLSSCLWSTDVRNLGKWIGPTGSDCGIVNVRLATSGLPEMTVL
jgi:aldehyde dehydrogenase family 7 protein A1